MPNIFPDATSIREIAQRYCSHEKWPKQISIEACTAVLEREALWEAITVLRETYEEQGKERGLAPVRYDLWCIMKQPIFGRPFRDAVREAQELLGWPKSTNIEIDDFCVLVAAAFTQANAL